jgi:hypothetical protein
LLHVFSSCANSDITTLRLANGQDGRQGISTGSGVGGGGAKKGTKGMMIVVKIASIVIFVVYT